MWKWPFPIRSTMEGNGIYFPTIPIIGQDEVKKIEEEKQLGDSINECDSNLPHEEILKIAKEYVEEYKNRR